MPFGRTNRFFNPNNGGTMRSVHEKIIAGIKAAQAYTKFWVAVAGAVFAIIASELPIPDDVAGWVLKIIAIATAFSVWAFPNAVPPVESD